ncbi:hypothetical protein [Mucilaginibacter sp. OK098]|uniref:hypothetical protein n=1 Tax=Mucilaginibacter sp. OK098 TaxID=1855297 RepID=UPI0009212F47|nr:hypothetical protein [Mucilaginibacter sp. OK098]SHM18995.1 hypothetical protein SAMN05216524_1011101 [Mucilaginibacter sp. OK098]
MKNSEKTGLNSLTRTELKQVKGGGPVNCTAVYQSCASHCGSYPAFAACVTGYTTMCSPLYGFGLVC